MTNPLLNILIPTVVGREQEYSKLYKKIESCIFFRKEFNAEDVVVTKAIDNKEITIGQKRNMLYEASSGLYSWQIDDDDDISDDAIELILRAIKENPDVDCVTFRERCIMNGNYKSSNHSLKYEKWQDNFDGFDYVRCPFYKDVIRTDIAKLVPFPFIRYNEDEQWSMAIRPHLKTEYHIDKELYYYIYEPKETHEERYGYDRS